MIFCFFIKQRKLSNYNNKCLLIELCQMRQKEIL